MSREHGPHECYCPSCGFTTTADTYQQCNTMLCPSCGASMRATETGEYRAARVIGGEARSAEIRGVNAPPEWTFWTLEMALPSVFVNTVPIGETIVYDGSISGGGIALGGDAISQIRVFIDINALPVDTFFPAGVIEDGKSYNFDFETGVLSEKAGLLARVLPFAVVGVGLFGLVVAKKRH